EIARENQAEWISALPAFQRDRAEPVAKTPLELQLENEIVAVDELLRILLALRPDERRAVALERQDGERPAGQKMLHRHPAMRALVTDGRRDTRAARAQRHTH